MDLDAIYDAIPESAFLADGRRDRIEGVRESPGRDLFGSFPEIRRTELLLRAAEAFARGLVGYTYLRGENASHPSTLLVIEA